MASIRVFDSGDAPYVGWRDRHPAGFVLNVRRAKSKGFVKLHRANCPYIGGGASSPNGFTQNNYFKVCSLELQDVLSWHHEHRTSVLQWCHACDVGALDVMSADEIQDPAGLPEGAKKHVWVVTYERSAKARNECIAHYGTSCYVCGFSFENRYGQVASGYIHVHHLIPLHKIGSTYVVDPKADLRPICPNCHAVVHMGGKVRSLDEVKAMLRGPGA